MGKGISKLDVSPLVSLCKERKNSIKAAEYCRYDLVSIHDMYLQSLLDVGDALNQYVEEELLVFSDPPQVSMSDFEPSEEDSHLEFPSFDSESDLDSVSVCVHNDLDVSTGLHDNLEVPGDPTPSDTENKDQSAANMDINDMKNRSKEIPCGIHEQHGFMSTCQEQESSNLSTSHPHSNQMNTHIPMDLLHEDHGHLKHNHRSSFGNRLETPQRMHEFPQHMNWDSFGPPMVFSYNDDRIPHYWNEEIPMDMPFEDQKFQKHDSKQTTHPTAQPTPPPPQVTTWDFLSPFSSMNNDIYYDIYMKDDCKARPNSSDPDLREVREREGIPELEDETEQIPELEDETEQIPELEDETAQSSTDTVFDEMEVERGLRHDSGVGTSNAAQLNSNEEASSAEDKELKDGGTATKKEINSETFVSKKLEPTTREGVSSGDEQITVLGTESLGTSSVSTRVASCRMDFREAVQEIREEFQSIFNFGKEISDILKVGKIPYHSISTKFKAFASRVLGLIVPSIVTYSRPPYMLLNQSASQARLFPNAEKRNNQEHVFPTSGDLSSTLEKLYAWEKKLYMEVTGEEKLRILYDNQRKRLKILDDRGSESEKIDDTMASMRHLHSEISVAVASITVISREIHKLRDHKLLPELKRLIEGLIRLWKFMATCHQKQLQAIMKAKSHVHISHPYIRKQSSSIATLRLEKTILNWSVCFSNLVNTQKAFVKYLNEWLQRCILHEPEETEDEIAPFSLSRTGAPLIFIVCNDWYQAIDKISEIGVSTAIDNFASSLHQLYEKQEQEQVEKLEMEYLLKDYDYRLRSFHKKNGISCHKDTSFTDMTALETEVPQLGGSDEHLATSRRRLIEQRARCSEVIKQVNDAVSSCLEEGLSPIFEALGRFCLENLQAYEKLTLPKARPRD